MSGLSVSPSPDEDPYEPLPQLKERLASGDPDAVRLRHF